MTTIASMRTRAAVLLRLGVVCLAGFTTLHAAADASVLRVKHAELRDELRNNNFQRALHIDSSEVGDALKGDVYAVLDHPFALVSKALKEPSGWCDVLLLPFNTKYCRPVSGNEGTMLHVRIGRKYNQPVEKAHRLNFTWQPVASTADYLETRLNAAHGPVGTKDYRIVMSAVPLDDGRTFMHLSYSYGFGVAGRMAMQAYLATAGADKIGFTVNGRDGRGQPIYIGGMRGAIERNAMRYYLAIDAHVASLRAPPEQQLDKRIEAWFAATERYARQLHEMDRATYVAMKRDEYERQQAAIQ
jgi:hypothetical protein